MSFTDKKSIVRHCVDQLEQSFCSKLETFFNHHYEQLFKLILENSGDIGLNKAWLKKKLNMYLANLSNSPGDNREMIDILESDLSNGTFNYFSDPRNFIRRLELKDFWTVILYGEENNLDKFREYVNSIDKVVVKQSINHVIAIRNISAKKHAASDYASNDISNEELVESIQRIVNCKNEMKLANNNEIELIKTQLPLHLDELENNASIDIKHNLPPTDYDNWGWTNRIEELELLKKEIKSYPKLCIQAEGGMGKTSLLLKYLNDYIKINNGSTFRPFDHIIWITGKDSHLYVEQLPIIETRIENTYKSFIMALYTAIYGPAQNDESFNDIEDFVTEYISQRKKMLFIIDNMESISNSDINEFIQKTLLKNRDITDNKVIATSRKDIEEFRIHKLSGMDQEQSLDLFQNVCKYHKIHNLNLEQSELQDALKLTNRTPLAIVYFAQLIRNHGYSSAIKTLQENPQDLLSFLFTELYKEIGKKENCNENVIDISKKLLWITTELEILTNRSSFDLKLIEIIYLKSFTSDEREINKELIINALELLIRNSFITRAINKENTEIILPPFVTKFIKNIVKPAAKLHFDKIDSTYRKIIRDTAQHSKKGIKKVGMILATAIRNRELLLLLESQHGPTKKAKIQKLNQFISDYGETEISKYCEYLILKNEISEVRQMELLNESIELKNSASSFLNNHVDLLQYFEIKYSETNHIKSILSDIKIKIGSQGIQEFNEGIRPKICKTIEELILIEFSENNLYRSLLRNLGGTADGHAAPVLFLYELTRLTNVNNYQSNLYNEYITDLQKSVDNINSKIAIDGKRIAHSSIALIYALKDDESNAIINLDKSLKCTKMKSKNQNKIFWMLHCSLCEQLVIYRYYNKRNVKQKDILTNIGKIISSSDKSLTTRLSIYNNIKERLIDV